MNVIRRAVSTQKCLFSSSPSPKCLFLSLRHTIVVQQGAPFSTSSNYSSTNHTLKAKQPRKPRTSRVPLPPSLISSKNVKKEGVSASTWPRPTEIPYQAKVANSVNLIGKIEMPIQFHATPDGKHMAATFIAQKNDVFNGKSHTSLLIPVVFEGDLAHTVACHVKQDDCVYVTGKLSLDPLPFVLSEDQGKFYVIGNELNFVQGLERQEAKPVEMDVGNDNVMKELVGNRKVKAGKCSKVEKEWEEFLANPDRWWVITSQDDGLKGSIEGFERKIDGERLDLNSSTPVWVYKKVEELNLENKIQEKVIEPLNTEKKSNKIEEKEIELLNTGKKRSTNVGGTTKDAYLDSWKDLLKNPKEWLDNREKKSSGLVKAKFPDFKNKTDGTPLWLCSAPDWVLPGLEGLDFDAQVQVPKGWPVKGGKVKNEYSWKSLVENPDKWWDNRSTKASTKAPDFKHKDTGEGLWLNSSPEWVLSQLPPSKNEQNVSAGNKKALGRVYVDAQVQVPKGRPAKDGKVKNEDGWKNLVENPDKWWDNRSRKSSTNSPDFRHKDTGEPLWLNSAPPEWVLSQLPPPGNEQKVSAGNKKAFMA